MGHVTPGYEIAVVDKDTGELCAEGETGELWMRGTRGIQLFLEYYDNPEANAKAFEDGWFKTGDMVKMGEGGNVFYQERDKDLLKVGGENVSAREVEDLVGADPGIAGGRRRRQAPRVPRPGRGRVRDHRARRARRTTTLEATIIDTCQATASPTSRCRARSTSSTSSRPARSTRCSRTSCARWPTSSPPSTDPFTTRLRRCYVSDTYERRNLMGDGQATTPDSRRRAMSSARPSSARISSVCSPSAGSGR